MNTLIYGSELCDDVLGNIITYISLGDLSTSICLVNKQFARVVCPIIQKDRLKFSTPDVNIRKMIEYENFLNILGCEDVDINTDFRHSIREIIYDQIDDVYYTPSSHQYVSMSFWNMIKYYGSSTPALKYAKNILSHKI